MSVKTGFKYLVSGAVLAGLLYLVWWRIQAGRVEGPEAVAPEVVFAYPLIEDVNFYNYFSGNTRAIELVEVRARVEGFLKTVSFEDGSDVNEGDLLFEIEREPYLARVQMAEAQLESAKVELERAQINFERVSQAAATGAVSKQDVSQKRAERDKAIAEIEKAKADLDQAKIQLGYTQIYSPIKGKVSRNYVTVGNVVGSGENTLLTEVVQMDPMYVYFNPSEIQLLEFLKKRAHQSYQEPEGEFYIKLADEDEFLHPGKLDYISPTVDEQTGTIEVRGIVDNNELLMTPGMFVGIRTSGKTVEDAVLVYKKAVGTDLDGKYMLVIDDANEVEYRVVELGQRTGEMVHVEDGLGEKERYILEGIQKARPGYEVRAIAVGEAGDFEEETGKDDK